MEKRRVIVSHYVQISQDGTTPHKWVLEPTGEAIFHQFGVAYEEFESGPGNYSTAIVEWPDGTVENVPVEQIRFVV